MIAFESFGAEFVPVGDRTKAISGPQIFCVRLHESSSRRWPRIEFRQSLESQKCFGKSVFRGSHAQYCINTFGTALKRCQSRRDSRSKVLFGH